MEMKFLTKAGLNYYNSKLKVLYGSKAPTSHTHSELLSEELASFVSSLKDGDTSGIFIGNLPISESEVYIDLDGYEVTDDSKIEIYTNEYGVSPKSYELTNGQIHLTFGKVLVDLDIVIVIR